MTSRNKIGLALLGALVLVGAGRLWLGFRSQPQLPPSDEVFKSVDALFTAVTSRDESRLAACEQRLQGYKEAGRLNKSAWKRLGGVIAQARAGGWDPAAHALYDFMQGQRREGIVEQSASRTLTATPSGKHTVLRPQH